MKPKILDKKISVMLNDHYLNDLEFLAKIWRVNRSQAIRIAIMSARMKEEKKGEKPKNGADLGRRNEGDAVKTL